MLKSLFLTAAVVCSSFAFGQASGNVNYKDRSRTGWNNDDTTIDFPLNYEMVVTAKGLANVKADAFVAIFSVVQVGKTAKEASQLMNQRLSAAQAALKAKNFETFVDMISFVPMYEYETEKKVFSKRTYNELPVGFELKQNLHIKIEEASQLNELIILLSESEIYDLVRMDYYASNLDTVKKELMGKVKAAFFEKQKHYEATLAESFATAEKKVTDGFVLTSPTGQYKSYEAYNSALLQGKRAGNIVQANKSVTQYYQPIADKDFDIILNPIVIEPVIQLIYEIKMSVNRFEKKNKEVMLLTPAGELKKLNLP